MTERTHEPSARPPAGGPEPLTHEPWHRGRAGQKRRHSVRRKARHGAEASTRPVNVGSVERVTSAVVGGTLLTFGLGRRSLGGAAWALSGGSLLHRGFTGYCRLYKALGLSTSKQGEQSAPAAWTGPAKLHASITIQKPAEELYRAWRDADVLSQVMGDVAEVTQAGPDLQHWKARGPAGLRLEWDSRLIDERPGELLRWEATEGADLPNRGLVSFGLAPGDWGTVVTLHFELDPPGGVLGDIVLKLLGNVPSKLAFKTLRRFKSLMEAGEIPTTGPNPAARASAHAP